MTKWNYRPYYWGYKSPMFIKEGVELDGKDHLLWRTTVSILKVLLVMADGAYGKENKWFGHIWFPYKETADGWYTYGVDWSSKDDKGWGK